MVIHAVDRANAAIAAILRNSQQHAEHRDRTTPVAVSAAAQNGTSVTGQWKDSVEVLADVDPNPSFASLSSQHPDVVAFLVCQPGRDEAIHRTGNLINIEVAPAVLGKRGSGLFRRERHAS